MFLSIITAFTGTRIARIALFTVLQALLSTVAAVIIGLPAAFFTARRSFPFRKILLGLSSVPFCIPSLLIALGYVTFFGQAGALNRFLMWMSGSETPPLSFLYSLAGIIICHGFYNFPLVMSTVNDGWERLPATEADAARLLGAGELRVFSTITVFQLLPSIISACIPVFLYCFFSFMIVLLFGSIGTTTLEVEIYQLAKINLDFTAALKTGVIETGAALLFVFIYTFIEQKSSAIKGISFENEYKTRNKIKGFELFPAFVLFSLIILFFICPLGAIASNGLSSRRFEKALTIVNFTRLFTSAPFWKSLRWTLITASMTGILCAFVAFFYSVLLKVKDPKGRYFLFRVIPVIPMAVSSVVTGIVLTLIVKKGTFLTLVIAQTLLNWPIAFRQIYPELQKLPQNTVDAALILSKKNSDVLFKVFLPVCKAGFIRAAGFCFAISAGDATLPLILAIPRFDTLALYVYRLAGTYKFNEACAAGVVLGLLCAGVFAVAKRK